MSFTRYVAMAVAVGCRLAAAAAGDAAAIKAVVAHFAKNAVKLEKEKEGDWWAVTDPKGDGYEVRVAWRNFPANATADEMRAEVKTINLAFDLNAPARIAMSYPGLRATDPAKQLPKLDDVPVVAQLQKLFKEYPSPEPKK